MAVLKTPLGFERCAGSGKGRTADGRCCVCSVPVKPAHRLGDLQRTAEAGDAVDHVSLARVR